MMNSAWYVKIAGVDRGALSLTQAGQALLRNRGHVCVEVWSQQTQQWIPAVAVPELNDEYLRLKSLKQNRTYSGFAIGAVALVCFAALVSAFNRANSPNRDSSSLVETQTEQSEPVIAKEWVPSDDALWISTVFFDRGKNGTDDKTAKRMVIRSFERLGLTYAELRRDPSDQSVEFTRSKCDISDLAERAEVVLARGLWRLYELGGGPLKGKLLRTVGSLADESCQVIIATPQHAQNAKWRSP